MAGGLSGRGRAATLLVAALCACLFLGGCFGGRQRPISPPRTERSAGPGEYTVRGGDTMYSIALRHDLDYRELARWNGIGSDYLIHPGQILRLSAPGSRPARNAPAPVPPVAGAPAPTVNSMGIPAPTRAGTAPGAATTAPAASAATAPLRSNHRWQWPAAGDVIRAPPASKGLDIAGDAGSEVRAAAPGRVVYSGSALQGYGELIIVKHDDQYLSAYGYNRRRLVAEGETVTAGQVIGEIGYGPENRPLLHFEIRSGGQPVDPRRLLPQR